MFTLLSTAHAGLIFAKAGQAVVEMNLIKGFVNSGKVRLILHVDGNDEEHVRFLEHFQPYIDTRKLEYYRKGEVDIHQLVEKADGLFIHGIKDLVMEVFRFRLMNKLAVFVHLHSLELDYTQRMGFKLPWHYWDKRFPVYFIAPSASTRNRISSLAHLPLTFNGSFPKAQVVPHGVAIAQGKKGGGSKIRSQLAISESAKVVLSFNRISLQKFDYVQLVLIFNEVLKKDQNRDLTLLIAGSASDEGHEMLKSLKKFIKILGIVENVKFLVDVEEEDKRSVYDAADVYVSLACNPQESFGIALLEAMAAGLPVVATDWNGYPEVLSSLYKDWLVPTIASHEMAWEIDATGDLEQLSTAAAPLADHAVSLLLKILSDRETAGTLRAIGLERVKTFTWDNTVGQLLLLWEDALKLQPNMEGTDSSNKRTPVITSPVDGLATHYLGPFSVLDLCYNHNKPSLISPIVSTISKGLPANSIMAVESIISQLTSGSKRLSDISIPEHLSYTNFFGVILLMIRRGFITLKHET